VVVAGCSNDRVRKGSPGGIIAAGAGTGTPGYVGNNGLVINAQLKYPLGVAVDGPGQAWFATAGGLGAIARQPMTLAQKAEMYELESETF
jgi:serine/threonine-protein kinase